MSNGERLNDSVFGGGDVNTSVSTHGEGGTDGVGSLRRANGKGSDRFDLLARLVSLANSLLHG